MNYEVFCSQILEVDSKVRFAAIYDSWAKRVAGGLREGTDRMGPVMLITYNNGTHTIDENSWVWIKNTIDENLWVWIKNTIDDTYVKL